MAENTMDRLIIVIPAYNEESNLEMVVRQWYPVLRSTGKGSCLLIVDDGSTDATWEILQKLRDRFPALRIMKKKNQGHGATVLYGYRKALELQPDFIFQTDSDGQTFPEDFWQLWKDRNTCGLLLGRRTHRQDGWERVLVTRVLRVVLRLVFGCWIADANSPFRLMRAKELKEVLEEIPENYHLANVLMTVIYRKQGRRVYDYPVRFRPRQGGKNSLNMKKICRTGRRAVEEFLHFRKAGWNQQIKRRNT